MTVLLVLLALLAIGFVIHQIYVRPPDIPTHENQEAGTDPGSLGVGRREDVYTFLLVGRDDGQGGGGNTDTMMVGCYDVKNGTVDVLSIYRDTMVDVPGEIPKINSVYNRQGIEGVQKQIKNLIGYTPDYYFVVELDAVETDGSGGLRTDLEALLAPIRTAKPYLFRTGEAEPPVLAGAVPAPPGGAPRRSYTMEELGRLTMEEYREARRIGAQGG